MARKYLVTSEFPIPAAAPAGSALLRPLGEYGGELDFFSSAHVRSLFFNQLGITQRVGFSGPFTDFVGSDLSSDAWRQCWAAGFQPSGLATIAGFNAQYAADFCRVKILRNYGSGGGFAITVNHLDGGAPLTSRVSCPGAVNYTWLPDTTIMLVHEADSGFAYDGGLSLSTDVWALIPLG